MKTILFQGDSITDVGRNRDDINSLGFGYPLLVSSSLGFDYPGEYNFINKGISGNRIVDVYARIKADIINLKPDIMSILIGVNDVWHEFDFKNGVDSEKYFKIYSMLIEEIKAELPDIKIMIMEPYVGNGSATADKIDIFRTEVFKRAEKAKKIAEKYNLTFIPLQKRFDEAFQSASVDYWLADGVHPNFKGHELIKREWIKAFKSL